MSSSAPAALTSLKMEWKSLTVAAPIPLDHFASQAVELGWIWLEASHGWLADRR